MQTGRGVPVVIIPRNAKAGLAYLADSETRLAAGVHKRNPYIFAVNGIKTKVLHNTCNPYCCNYFLN